MSARGRIAITVAAAIALGVAAVGIRWSVGDRPTSEVWDLVGLAVLGLAVVGVFVVNRWWALMPAVSTIAISWLGDQVYEPRGHWSTESIALSFPVSIVVMALEAAALAALLSSGLLARSLWDQFRHPRTSTATHRGIER